MSSIPTEVAKQIALTNPGNIDKWRGPYPTIAEANLKVPNTIITVDGVPTSFRLGKFVEIGIAPPYKTYWWNGSDYANDKLVEYNAVVSGTPTNNQLLDKTSFTPDFYVSNTGGLSPSSGAQYANIPLDPLQTNITFDLRGGSVNKYYSFRSSTDTILGYGLGFFTTNNAIVSVPIPAGSVRVLVTTKNTAESATVKDTMMINYGTSALPFEPFGFENLASVNGKTIPYGNYYKKAEVFSKPEVSALLPVINIVSVSKNRVKLANIYANFLQSSATGAFLNNAAGWNIAVVPVTGLETVTISGWNSARNELGFYNGTMPTVINTGNYTSFNGQLVSSGHSNSIGLGLKSSGTLTFVVPAGATWMIINIANATEPDSTFQFVQVESGSASTGYQPGDLDAVNQINSKPVTAKYLDAGATLGGKTLVTTDMLPSSVITSPVVVVKIGNDYYIRTSFDDTNDLVQKNTFQTTAILNDNGSFDFISATLIPKAAGNTLSELTTGTVIRQNNNDDVPPFNTASHGHIGEGHGLPCPVTTGTAHGKTSADINSLWLKDGIQYYLVAIRSSTSILWYSKPHQTNPPTNTELKTNGVITAGTMTHVSGATNTADITVSSSVSEQQYPLHFNPINKCLVDGIEITIDGTYGGNKVEFKCEYDIADPNAIAITNPIVFNNAPSWVRMSNTYEYQRNGVCLVKDCANFKRLKTLTYWYGLQAIKLTVSAGYTKVFYRVPETLPVSSVDWNVFREVTTNPSDTTFLRAHRKRDAFPTNRLISVLTDSSNVHRRGFVMGFDTRLGITKHSTRISLTEDWNIASTAKSYPRAVVNYPALDQFIQMIGYRAFYNAELIGDASSLIDYMIGNYSIVVLDNIGVKTKASGIVPKYLEGKQIIIEESSAGFTLLNDVVNNRNIFYSASGSTDYAILKLV